VEEAVCAAYHHPLCCCPLVQDVDQHGLLHSPSCPAARGERESVSVEPVLKRWSEREATGQAFREMRGNMEEGETVEQPCQERRWEEAPLGAQHTGGVWHGGQEAEAAIRAEGRG
jgi:hypothetical protein